MNRSIRFGKSFILALILIMAGSSAGVVLSADRGAGRTRPAVVVEMPMQIATEGISYEEYLFLQSDRQQMLMSEMPAGTLDDPLRAEPTSAQIEAVEQAPRRNGTPMQIGLVLPSEPQIDSADIRSSVGSTPGGSLLWARAVRSESAGALRLHLENLSLPASAALYFYSPAGEAFGPYTGSGPTGDGDLWTDTVYGTDGILQLRVSGPSAPADLEAVSFTVTEIGIVLPRFSGGKKPATWGGTTASAFCGNQSCIVDATCMNVAAANPAKDAVAKMEWAQGAYIYTCTGGLIADSNPSQNNYFLTANHCVSKANTAKNVQFYWRFASAACNGTCPSNTGWSFKNTGAAVRATGRKGDFTLLQLNANPPSGSVFLGWTNAAVANTNGAQLYRISNPNFGPQVYSQHNIDATVGTCSGWPRGERIYSRDVTGAIDGGSSGSPIINGSSQIVGQLSGTCGSSPSEVCSSGPGEANATVDGAFAFYYSTVQPFINP